MTEGAVGVWEWRGVVSVRQTHAREDNKQVGVGQASVMYAISRPPLPPMPPHLTRSVMVMTVSNGLCLSETIDQTSCLVLFVVS